MVGGMHGRGGICGGDMRGRGACMAGRLCIGRGYVWWGVCMGVCMAGGMHGGGGYVWHGGCVAGETATTVGSTHPTGMHSCFFTVVPAINRSYVPATTRKRLGISGIGEAWVKPV